MAIILALSELNLFVTVKTFISPATHILYSCGQYIQYTKRWLSHIQILIFKWLASIPQAAGILIVTHTNKTIENPQITNTLNSASVPRAAKTRCYALYGPSHNTSVPYFARGLGGGRKALHESWTPVSRSIMPVLCRYNTSGNVQKVAKTSRRRKKEEDGNGSDGAPGCNRGKCCVQWSVLQGGVVRLENSDSSHQS